MGNDGLQMSLTRILADELPITSVKVSVICLDQVRTWADFCHTLAFFLWSFGVYQLKMHCFSNLKFWQWSCALVVSRSLVCCLLRLMLSCTPSTTSGLVNASSVGMVVRGEILLDMSF